MSGTDPKAIARAMDALTGETGFFGHLGSIFGKLEWADEEVKKAIERHPDKWAPLYHTYTVLTPTSALVDSEVTYRAHCRELLERVATGKDLCSATAAELASVCSRMSEVAPLTTEATLVYMRAFARAFPDSAVLDGEIGHYEHIAFSGAEMLDAKLRRKLRQPQRVIDVVCSGQHWGEPVECPYMAVRDAS